MTPAQQNPAADDPPLGALGLRERKKARTRQAIQRTACRLFTDQGYEATPVEQIAEEAEVSPSTLFRYFPAKEDTVLTDEYGSLLERALTQRPAGEPPLDALRNAASQMLEQAAASPEEEHRRLRLASQVPAVRARLTQHAAECGRHLAQTLAERTGRPADDLDLRIHTGALLGGLTEALLHWAEHGSPGDLPAVSERCLTVLANGLSYATPAGEPPDRPSAPHR